MKTKKDISPGQIVMIVLLSLILLFMLLMRYFARIQLVNVFEQDFMELEKYEYMKSISEDKDTKNKMEIKNNINPFIQ